MSNFMGTFVVPGGTAQVARARWKSREQASGPFVTEEAFFRTWHRNPVSNLLLPSWVLRGRLAGKGEIFAFLKHSLYTWKLCSGHSFRH